MTSPIRGLYRSLYRQPWQLWNPGAVEALRRSALWGDRRRRRMGPGNYCWLCARRAHVGRCRRRPDA